METSRNCTGFIFARVFLCFDFGFENLSHKLALSITKISSRSLPSDLNVEVASPEYNPPPYEV